MIDLDKPSAAKKLVREVFKSVKRLCKFPKSGRFPPDLPNTSYRELFIGPCRLYYRIEKNNVYLLYVMRSERKLKNYILNERVSSES